MKWKVFLTASISWLFTIFPENLIGCSDGGDPADYYTSFFSREIVGQKSLKPFYYTSLSQFYWDETDGEKQSGNEKIIQEWKNYCDNKPTVSDVRAFVYQTSPAQITEMINRIGSGKGATITGDLGKNSMAAHLIKQADVKALAYLSFAKQTEKFSVRNDWEANSKRDSISINKFIDEAFQILKRTTENFLKSKYAFQLCKLAFYNNRNSDCIKWYDEYFNDNTSAVQEMALSYKGGSLFRIKRYKESAYAFSKVFTSTSIDKEQTFLGFLWSTQNCNPALMNDYLSICKNDKERANMVAMFSMHGSSYNLEGFRKVYALDPSSAFLPLLVSREVNKLEEYYLTPLLEKEKGGKQYYYTWIEARDLSADKKQAELAIKTFETIGKNAKQKDRAIYLTAAAYLSIINKNYIVAQQLIADAKLLTSTESLKDQLELLNLLIIANEPAKLDAQTESAILPSLKRLNAKAAKNNEYKIFLRNFISEVIAQRYEQQNEKHKAALAYGFADKNAQWWSEALDFIQEEMTTAELLKLYELFKNPTLTAYDKYFLQNSSLSVNNVINTIGTSHLRDFNFKNAVDWLNRATVKDTLKEEQYISETNKWAFINVDPFYDYVNDTERFDKSLPSPYTKLSLAQKLLSLQTKLESTTDKEAKAKLYYQLASGLYNLSFYGNSSSMVNYYRHSTSWNTGIYKSPWEKEYYGLHKARAYYQKAYELTSNKEFKAACYFLIIKCAQRQIIAPESFRYSYSLDEDDDPELRAFWKKFKYNPLFTNFKKEFGQTKYYNYVFDRCSYLRDFISKK